MRRKSHKISIDSMNQLNQNRLLEIKRNMKQKDTMKFSGKNIEDVQAKNRSVILQLLRLRGTTSRKELAELTGLNPSTVTYIMKDLLEQGWVREIRPYTNYKTIGVQLNPDSHYVIGIQLARRHIICGLFNLEGKVLASERIEMTAPTQVDAVIAIMKDLIRKLMDNREIRERVRAIGIAAPGPINLRKGSITFISHFLGWRDIPIKEILENEFKIETIVEHDAHAAALAEKWLGIGQEAQNLIYVSAGREGVGAGLIFNQEIYHGSLGIAGEFGHTSIDLNGPPCECGNIGCLELYCTGEVLARKIQGAIDGGAQSSYFTKESSFLFKDVVAAVKSGDPLTIGLVREMGRYLGAAIVNLINTLNPDMVILGDRLTEFGSIWLEIIRSAVYPRLLPEIANHVKIELTSFEGDAFLIGTGAIAIEHILNKPW